jgi:hypothetical protein
VKLKMSAIELSGWQRTMEVTMRASVVVVGGMSCVGVECKWSMIMNSGDVSIFDFGCRS